MRSYLVEGRSPGSKFISRILESPTLNNIIINSSDFLENIPLLMTLFENQMALESLKNVVSTLSDSCNYLNSEENKDSTKTGSESEAVIKVFKPLCADYRSDSDVESVDSESDSSTLSKEITTESSSESDSSGSQNSGSCDRRTKLHQKKSKREEGFLDLPPIEDLKISVPEGACIEIGTITSIVDNLVVVESYKGTAALDLDTVLFLNCGNRTLGRIFDILGPITEPVYAVRFNSEEHIKNLAIKKGLKVYFAPKTEHTNFVFMSEVLKNRGSDASWKDNAEAPLEFQDFSDDEEERLHNKQQSGEYSGESSVLKDRSQSRKRSFSKITQTSAVVQPTRFVNRSFIQQKGTDFHLRSSGNQYAAPFSSPRPNVPSSTQALLFPYNTFSCPLPRYYPPRFSGPPFPTFRGHPSFGQIQHFQRPFYQQRTHPFSQTLKRWGPSMIRSALPPPPPPPPPPPSPPSSSPEKKV